MLDGDVYDSFVVSYSHREFLGQGVVISELLMEQWLQHSSVFFLGLTSPEVARGVSDRVLFGKLLVCS